jgi:3-polyprenyl-4-hydroxybenzoate decarboxylase
MNFYSRPRSLEDMTRQMAGRLLSVFGLEPPGFQRWGEKCKG